MRVALLSPTPTLHHLRPNPRPPPPAACLLDVEALDAATGLAWTPDPTTAGDDRCVYDPADAERTEFLVVTIEPAIDDPALDTPALDTPDLDALCASGTSMSVGGTGFVCRLPDGGVFAALVRDDELVTVAMAEIPTRTSAEQVGRAFAAQLDRVR